MELSGFVPLQGMEMKKKQRLKSFFFSAATSFASRLKVMFGLV